MESLAGRDVIGSLLHNVPAIFMVCSLLPSGNRDAFLGAEWLGTESFHCSASHTEVQHPWSHATIRITLRRGVILSYRRESLQPSDLARTTFIRELVLYFYLHASLCRDRQSAFKLLLFSEIYERTRLHGSP
jgi:hypothetical protein